MSKLHLGHGHGGHGLAGLVVELMPGRHAGVHVEVGGGGAVAAVDLGRVLLGEAERAVALEPEALDLRARVVPGRATASRRRGAPGPRDRRRRVGIEIDVVLVQRPEVAAVVGGLAEQRHAVVAAVGRVGRDVVGQFHVVAVALPVVLDDGEVVHAVGP